MTLENEKRLLLLMSSYTLKEDVTKSKVLDYIETHKWAHFSEHELTKKLNRNELVWRNDFAFTRKHLVQNGFFCSGKYNDWSITHSGLNELKKLCNQVLVTTNFQKITSAGVNAAKVILQNL